MSRIFTIKEETLYSTASKIREKLPSTAPTAPTFNPGIFDADGNIKPDSVVYYFTEYFDNYGGKGPYDSADPVVGYAYLENNRGEIVPVLRTNRLDDYGEWCAEDSLFYEGTAMVDGVIYDKWRKIEEYDHDGNFTWDDEIQKFYVYSNRIVISGEPTTRRVFNSDIFTVEGTLIRDSIINYYAEFIDVDREVIQDYFMHVRFGDYGYSQNNSGITVPILYKVDEYGIDYEGFFFYDSTVMIDSTPCDRWRKIEPDNLEWDDAHKVYYYTNQITTPTASGLVIYPTEFPEKIEEVYQVGKEEGRQKGEQYVLDIANSALEAYGFPDIPPAQSSDELFDTLDNAFVEANSKGYNKGYEKGEQYVLEQVNIELEGNEFPPAEDVDGLGEAIDNALSSARIEGQEVTIGIINAVISDNGLSTAPAENIDHVYETLEVAFDESFNNGYESGLGEGGKQQIDEINAELEKIIQRQQEIIGGC